jgi:hypothetical protein
LATAGGGRKKQFRKIFLALVGQNPEESGKFVSAPLIFSFRYAHVWWNYNEKREIPLRAENSA